MLSEQTLRTIKKAAYYKKLYKKFQKRKLRHGDLYKESIEYYALRAYLETYGHLYGITKQTKKITEKELTPLERWAKHRKQIRQDEEKQAREQGLIPNYIDVTQDEFTYVNHT